MTPEEMYRAAMDIKEGKSDGYTGLTLVLPNGCKFPKRFPRGELLCESQRGRVYSFKPDKIIEFLKKNGLNKEITCQ